METDGKWTAGGRWHARRGLGTAMAAIIMVVVIAIVGGGTYFAFSGVSTSSSSGPSGTHVGPTSCAPATSAICQGLSGGHDVFLSVLLKSAQATIPVQFTAQYGGTGKVSYYLYNFGDGSAVDNSTSSVVYHTYMTGGTFIASVQAKVVGQTQLHDNYQRLLVIPVNPSSSGSDVLELPKESTTLVANSSSTVSPTALLPGTTSWIKVNGTYTSAPTDPAAVEIAPTLVTDSAGTITSSTLTSGATYVQAEATFSTTGPHWVTLVGGATVGGTTYYQNYTWSVFVAPPGVSLGWVAAGTGTHSSTSTTKSLHPGTLDIYEYIPGGSYSEDPAYDYETAGYEPIINVYQTLIAYNGSDTGSAPTDYVPELATCVPGSTLCTNLYGAQYSGIQGYNYTFVLNPNSRFYDPSTGASWPVYPSDVVFSLARTMGFSTGIAFGATNGWIVTQALLSAGNATWDAMHATVNNTPQNVFASMSVNDSQWCPAAAMTMANGCVTFHADANGLNWPYFMELIADGLGSSIVPCGWFSADAQGAGIPMWTNGTEMSSDAGDHPCTLPGGATNTTSSAFTNAVAAMNPKGWDSWEKLGSGATGTYVGNVQWNMLGSGPYYMKALTPGSSYLLQANPAYVAPCSWTGCEPAAGTYAHTVSVIWEQTATPGEEAYKAGIADAAGVPLPDLSFLLNLVDSGTVSLTEFPTISIYFFPFNMQFDVAGAQSIVPTENVGSTALSELALRQFLVNAYPYATVQSTIQERNGLTFGINYGGAIPLTMQYNQQNISWPAGDPTGSASTPGTAQWWWSQATNSASPYYDSQLATCSSSSPCIVPMMGELGAPDVDQRITAWASEVSTISGGALQIASNDLPFFQLVGYSTASAPGSNPLGAFTLGWAPDYPDPTDYVTPMYLANSTYTYSDAVAQQLENVTQGFDSPACHSSSDYGYWAVQANNHAIPNNCQGAAYEAMNLALHVAASDTNSTSRNILYWQAESIANGLALYLYFEQSNIVESAASYLNLNSFNSNVTIGGGQDNTWYTVTYLASGNGATD